jgi:protein-disulfide isomerase
MSIRSLILLAALACAAAAPAAAQDDAHAALLKRAAESRAKGAANATVLVYEIADFQCPHCARFAVDVFPRIDSAYIRTGRVQWVFVNLPMPAHAQAWHASEAALCAGAVADRFWIMHDRLFVAGQEWIGAPDAAQVIARYARESGVPMEAWTACVTQDRVAPIILQDVIFGSRVSGTPTFIINNQQTIVGVKTFEEWRDVLEAALRRK